MKNYLIISLLIVTGLTRAQDQLLKRDNSKLLVKVIEISSQEIKYKSYDNKEVPIYVIDKREIKVVKNLTVLNIWMGITLGLYL